jgi:hypothetical protein
MLRIEVTHDFFFNSRQYAYHASPKEIYLHFFRQPILPCNPFQEFLTCEPWKDRRLSKAKDMYKKKWISFTFHTTLISPRMHADSKGERKKRCNKTPKKMKTSSFAQSLPMFPKPYFLQTKRSVMKMKDDSVQTANRQKEKKN